MLGWHVIFGTYGFWLPNDPRGSWSTWVGAWELFRYGPATKVDTPASLASVEHDWAQRRAAKRSLKYPAVTLDGLQARAAGMGFAEAAQESRYVLHGCAILREHVHLVIARYPRSIKRIVGHLKGRATQRMTADGVHPHQDVTPMGNELPTPWCESCWKVFLDTPADLRRAIEYVNDNPEKEGLPRQRWKCVTEMR